MNNFTFLNKIKFNNKNGNSGETIFIEDGTILEDLKCFSRLNEIQLFGTMIGNFGVLNIFLGSECELHDMLSTAYASELYSGSISIMPEYKNLNISSLKKLLKSIN